MKLTRREFIGHGTGILAIGTGLTLAKPAAAAEKWNRFAYDISNYSRTDPKLIGFEQETSFSSGVQDPRRLAVGKSDALLVAGRDQIAVFDATGTRLRAIRLASPATCVAAGPDGKVYVGLKDHLEVFTPEGAPAGAWDTPGPKTWFTGLAVNDRNLFAADSGNRVVVKYDLSGKVASRIAAKDKAREIPGLVVPSPYLDVDLGKDGLLRVNNPGRHRVEIYTVEGDLELFWGRPSAAVDGFCGCCNPIAICMLPDGRMITCEKGLPRVKVCGTDGKLECVVAGPEAFAENGKAGATYDPTKNILAGMDAAVDSQGRVSILDLVTGEIRVMKRKPA